MKKIVFFLHFFIVNQASAQYYFFRDSSGKVEINELVKKPVVFKQKHDFDSGLDNVWFWMKVPINNKGNSAKKLYFLIENPYLDLVHVYQIRNQKIIRDFGEYNYATPINNRLIKHHHFVYPINLLPNHSDTLYVKIHRHFLKVFAPFRFLEEEEFRQFQSDKYLIYALFSGVILTLFLFSIINYFVNFEAYFLHYSGYLICILGSVILVEGYLIEYLQKANFLFSIYNWRNVFNILAALSLSLFIKDLMLKGAENHKFINVVFWVSIVGTSVSLVLMALEKLFYENRWQQPDIMLWLPHSGYVTGALCCFFMVMYSYFKGVQSFIAKSFFVGIIPIFIYTLFSLLKNVSLIQDTSWLSYKVRLLCILFDVFVLFVGITLQIRKLRIEKDRAARLALENELNLYKEKERISRDLHDSVGSQLTIVTSSLDNAIYLAEKQKLGIDKIEKIYEYVREAIQSLRDSIWVTHQKRITFLDFETRLNTYLSKSFDGLLTFTADFKEIQNTVELSSIQAINLFRVLQEAIQNTVKHASANAISIKAKLYSLSFTF
ncbi:7TM-DISM domain-containing protein [Runella sp.]|uniref:sensor histidine kinase n=1 Tax=Runella sp. TaxID=1960881 RepID=UPI0030172CEF